MKRILSIILTITMFSSLHGLKHCTCLGSKWDAEIARQAEEKKRIEEELKKEEQGSNEDGEHDEASKQSLQNQLAQPLRSDEQYAPIVHDQNKNDHALDECHAVELESTSPTSNDTYNGDVSLETGHALDLNNENSTSDNVGEMNTGSLNAGTFNEKTNERLLSYETQSPSCEKDASSLPPSSQTQIPYDDGLTKEVCHEAGAGNQLNSPAVNSDDLSSVGGSNEKIVVDEEGNEDFSYEPVVSKMIKRLKHLAAPLPDHAFSKKVVATASVGGVCATVLITLLRKYGAESLFQRAPLSAASPGSEDVRYAAPEPRAPETHGEAGAGEVDSTSGERTSSGDDDFARQVAMMEPDAQRSEDKWGAGLEMGDAAGQESLSESGNKKQTFAQDGSDARAPHVDNEELERLRNEREQLLALLEQERKTKEAAESAVEREAQEKQAAIRDRYNLMTQKRQLEEERSDAEARANALQEELEKNEREHKRLGHSVDKPREDSAQGLSDALARAERNTIAKLQTELRRTQGQLRRTQKERDARAGSGRFHREDVDRALAELQKREREERRLTRELGEARERLEQLSSKKQKPTEEE